MKNFLNQMEYEEVVVIFQCYGNVNWLKYCMWQFHFSGGLRLVTLGLRHIFVD